MHYHIAHAITVVSVLMATVNADEIRVPTDQPTIQQAITAAVDGDTILIAPGIWSEHLDPLGKSIEIRGEGVAAEIILTSPDGGTMLTIDSPEPPTTVFADLTFTGGVDETLVQIGRGSPTFLRCIFRDNDWRAVSESGSCEDIDGATYVDCLFMDNQEPNGGAVRTNQSNSLFDRCTFLDNVATGQTSGVNAGGALYVDDWGCGTHQVDFRECTFIGNSAVWGGVIYVQGYYPSSTFRMNVDDCRFVGNSASQGRSMWVWYTTTNVQGSYFCGGGDQIHNGWGDAGGNVFVDNCAGAEEDDCDGDRIPDALAIAVGMAADCDGDGQPDSCTTGMPKIDADGNGIPDVCESLPCPADLSGNGVVDGGDLGIWLSLAGYDCQSDPECPADVNDDGVSDGADLGAILAAWGECPN